MTVDEWEIKIENLKRAVLAFVRQKGREVNELEIVDAFAGRVFSEVCISDVLREMKRGFTLQSATRKVGAHWLTYWTAVKKDRELF